MLSTGANVCGLVLGGTLGDRLGSREMLVAGALVTVVAAVALGRSAAACVQDRRDHAKREDVANAPATRPVSSLTVVPHPRPDDHDEAA